MGKLQEKKQKKLEALLDAAFELYTSKGITETSISDIVKRADVAKGTFYLYFKDKYQVRDCLISKQARIIVNSAVMELKKATASTLEDKMIFMADYIIDVLEQNKILLKFVSKNLSWGVFQRTVLAGQGTGKEENMYDMFLDLLEESGRKFRKPDLMIYMIIELINATCHNVILYEEPVSLRELKPDLYLMVRQMIKNYEIAEAGGD